MEPISFALAALLFSQGKGVSHPLPPIPRGTDDQLRVLIFPHLTEDLPQGKDTVIDHATLTSAQSCRAYQGASDGPEMGGDLLQTATSFPLQASDLETNGPLWIECDSPATLHRPGGSPSYSYSGAFYARSLPGSGTVDVINVLSVEDYLKGVVPGEMPAHWAPEALKAQAIAARTYALFHAQFARAYSDHPDYDVDDTTYYQAYEGFGVEDPRSNAAVEATAGLALFSSGKPVEAYFHADSGGYTEDADHVWPVKAPYCTGKKEVFAPNLGEAPWTVNFTAATVNRKLSAAQIVPNGNPVMEMSIVDRFPSGRAKSVHLVLLDGTETDVDAQVFRRTLGMRSTMFSLTGAWQITGRGNGHGVGMNQTGANVLASTMGWTYEKILDFYYTGLDLVNNQ